MMGNKNYPRDWQNTSTIFAKALAYLLAENEGVILDVDEETFFELDSETDKIIVYYKDKKVCIGSCERDLEEGTIVMVHDFNPN